MDSFEITTIVGALGFLLGISLGAVAQRTNFCTMGAVSDAVFMGDWVRMRSWMLAMATAILGSQAMHYFGVVDLKQTFYLSTNLSWAVYIIGGLLFGFGMTMTGGCGNKNLVRLGTGNLKSLLVLLVIGLFAYMTQRGLIGPIRLDIEALTAIDLSEKSITDQGIPSLLVAALGMESASLDLVVAGVFGLALLGFCFKDKEFRGNGTLIFAGLAIGAMIPAAWYITGVVGFDDFEPAPLRGLTFISPVGESMLYLMTFTGSTISFGVSTVGGVIVGSFLAALVGKQLNFEAFSQVPDMGKHIIGAAMMGTGAVMALGCTVGQGISGIATLSSGSYIALLSILFGAVWGLRYMETGSVVTGLGAVFKGSE